MFAKPGKISRKIVGMLMVFLIVATTAIGLTLVISWQLEGVAAAINDGGSQRMRTYRIGHLMARGLESQAPGEPLMRDYLAGNAQQREMALDSFDTELEPFVGRINDLVLATENSYANDTNL